MQGWFDLAVFAHVILPAPWESFPKSRLQEFIPNSVNENLLDSRISPCQVAFHFFFFNIFMDRFLKCLRYALKITLVWNCFRHWTPQRGQLPQLKVNLWAKRAKRVQKTRSPRRSWASRKAANRSPGSSRTRGSSRQLRPTPSRTEETLPRNPPSRRQRRGSHSEGFLRALYVNLILSFLVVFQLI